MLPDILGADLKVVFCGTAAGERSVARGHYYAGVGNEFWRYLFASRLTPRLLQPQEDASLPKYGIGLTDIAKGVSQSHDRGLSAFYDVGAFVAKIEQHAPTWVAFHGKEAAKVVARSLRHRTALQYGPQQWLVESARVFVVPSASGANREPAAPGRRHRRLDGKNARVEWFLDLADAISTTPSP